MLNFLKQTRKLLNATSDLVCIVIGNESCDLDSAVCAITLAYYYEKQQTQPNFTKANKYLPVLNIPRDDYALKTEVKYLFNKYGICAEDLIFRNDLKEDFLNNCDFVLVDHHVSPFVARCVQVFDHRPLDKSIVDILQCKNLNIELVGSCATLIAEQFLQLETQPEYQCIYHLLRNTIILDTVNFSKTAERATEKDISVCEELEKLLSNSCETELISREEIFNELIKARTDVSHLNASQLLRKDLKIINNDASNITIALPGLPINLTSFMQRPDVSTALNDFATQQKCQIVLLLSMFMEKGEVQRELAVLDFVTSELCGIITSQLLNNETSKLHLEHSAVCFKGNIYKQQNIKATRKHILPIIKQILDEYEPK